MTAAELPARNGRPREQPAFLLALLISVGVYLAGLALLRWPAAPIAPPPDPAPFVHYVEAGNAGQAAALRDEEMLSDPQMIYTLTPFNFAMRAPAAPAARPQPALPPYPLQPQAGDVDKTMRQISSASVATATPADALKPAQMDALHTMGQAPVTSTPLPARGAQLHIVPAAVEGKIQDITWPPELAPDADAGGALWQPANFLLIFNAAGLVGEPLLVGSLSVAKTDENPKVEEDLRQKLGGYFRRNPLPPGSYTVEIGP